MSAVVDTSFLEALHNSREEKHGEAVALAKRMEKGEFGSLLLHEYVFDEAVTLAYSHGNKTGAIAIGDWLLSSKFEFVPSENNLFSEAWQLFRKTSLFSFTDCTIAVLAKKRGAAVITFDKRFSTLPGLRVIN